MNNKKLVEKLKTGGVLKTLNYINAFLQIDRVHFVPPELKEEAYEDMPLPIGQGQTISQPWTVAFMIELLSPQKGQKILDIGAGSGWQTTLLAHIVGAQGKVIAIERIPELCEFGKNNVSKFNFIQSGRIEFICADGSKGAPSSLRPPEGFDRIILAASAFRIPQALIEQLGNGGMLVGVEGGNVVRISKDKKGVLKRENFYGFSFVPLIEG